MGGALPACLPRGVGGATKCTKVVVVWGGACLPAWATKYTKVGGRLPVREGLGGGGECRTLVITRLGHLCSECS